MANVIQKGSTYYAPKGAYYEGNVRIDGDFIVPARTHFWGRLVVTGKLELGMKSSVALDVECGSAVIGSHARIKGPLVADRGCEPPRSLRNLFCCGGGESHHQARCPRRGRDQQRCDHCPRQDKEREINRQEHEGPRELMPDPTPMSPRRIHPAS